MNVPVPGSADRVRYAVCAINSSTSGSRVGSPVTVPPPGAIRPRRQRYLSESEYSSLSESKSEVTRHYTLHTLYLLAAVAAVRFSTLLNVITSPRFMFMF